MMRRKTDQEHGVGWAIQSALQIIAITLCAFILINMGIEDAQPPRPLPTTVSPPCTDFGIPK